MENKFKQGYQYRDSGKFEEALNVFKELSADASSRARGLMELAKTYKMMNRPSDALDFFANALKADPWNMEAVKELGETARFSGRLDKAIQTLDETGDGKSFAQLELSTLYYDKNDLASSAAALKAAEKLDPSNTGINIGRGRIYRKQGDSKKAASEFKKALAVEPSSTSALSELADIYSCSGDLPKAIEYYNKAALLSPGDKNILLKLVELHAVNGKTVLSDKAAQQVLQLTPDKPFDRDSMLNKIEILQKKTELSSKVKRLWVTVTTRCNIRCKTCGLWHEKWDLPYKTAQEVMEYYPTLERVVWLGGEVFLYKHFEEMFDTAAKYPNMKQQVITNGILLDDKWMKKIITTPNVELTFSVDGVTKQVYESIRQGSDFDKLLRNINRTMELKKQFNSKIDIRMNVLIMRSNFNQIEELLDFAHERGFNQISYLSLHLVNAPEENIFYESKEPAIMRFIGEVIPKLKEKAKSYNMEIDILLPPGELDFNDIVEQKQEPHSKGPVTENKPETAQTRPKDIYCRMPWQYMMICDHGNVILTGSCIKSIGNISENSLDEIWNSEAAQTYRRKMIENQFEGLCRTECMSRWDK
jgi:MoaA/NifB/PqqE/SkfB family radical SAM enzyme/Tfp pilus assembly protein PilF